jgi:predicted short-subunit dehydrogenase-like oxidoreductase (DUF2520 family)
LNKIRNIVLLGSGNVASNLAVAIFNAGIKIIQVYSRNLEHAGELAEKVDSDFTSDLSKLFNEADLYLFAVTDPAILQILKNRDWQDKLLVHTAGSVPADIFKDFTNRYGVIYPFQTFTKGREVKISECPFFIEADSELTNHKLDSFVHKFSAKVNAISFEQRIILHLSGVFASNFGNHMLTIASELLYNHGFSMEILKPLMEETYRKAFQIGPKDAQTGPAIRNNMEIMEKHFAMLSAEPDWQKIYTFVSESIVRNHKIIHG